MMVLCILIITVIAAGDVLTEKYINQLLFRKSVRWSRVIIVNLNF